MDDKVLNYFYKCILKKRIKSFKIFKVNYYSYKLYITTPVDDSNDGKLKMFNLNNKYI